MDIYEDFRHTSSGSFTTKYSTGGEHVAQYPSILVHERRREGTRRRKPEVLDPTPYRLRDHKFSPLTGSVRTTTWWKGWTEGSGVMGNFSLSPIRTAVNAVASDIDVGMQNAALVSALSKLDQKDLDLGTAWSERSKTADLVTATARTGVNAIRCILRRDGRGLLSVLNLNQPGARGKGVVDAYLAYHYGMKPLLQDVSGAVQALARHHPEKWTIRTRGSQKDERKRNLPLVVSTGVPVSVRYQSFRGSRATVTATQRPLQRRNDLAWALGLDNPLGTAWELTPFSFVVDWMFPIGDWLAALNSLKYYSGYLTTLSWKFDEDIRLGPASTVISGDIIDAKVHGSSKTTVLNRQVVAGPIIPGLPVKDPKSLDHMAKGLALLASLSSSKLPRHIRY